MSLISYAQPSNMYITTIGSTNGVSGIDKDLMAE